MSRLDVDDIARLMDPAEPPSDPRSLARRHRWQGGEPPAENPSGSLLERHNHPATRTHRFLFYNTFLVPGLQLSPGLAGVGRLGLALAQVGLLLGRSVAPGIRSSGDARLSPLLGRLDPGANGPVTIDLMAKAQYRRRAVEMGGVVAREYDIAALCEVFTPRTREQVLAAMAQQGRTVAHAAGPPAGGGVGRVDSGLLTVAMDRSRRQVRSASRVYSRHGDPLREGDAWATKGVLLTVVDLGPGKLELYSTHLLAGNDLLATDLPVLRALGPSLSPEQWLDLRLSQVDDLLHFYREEHDPRNVAMVVGDFNLSAQDPASHEALSERMAGAGLLDAWPYPGRQRPLPQGDTHATGGWGRSSRLEQLGPLDQGGYLDDALPAPQPSSRIDYIFVERPTEAHAFHLDLSRVRRRAFPRRQDRPGAERFLSDHVGLETTLIASTLPA